MCSTERISSSCFGDSHVTHIIVHFNTSWICNSGIWYY